MKILHSLILLIHENLIHESIHNQTFMHFINQISHISHISHEFSHIFFEFIFIFKIFTYVDCQIKFSKIAFLQKICTFQTNWIFLEYFLRRRKKVSHKKQKKKTLSWKKENLLYEYCIFDCWMLEYAIVEDFDMNIDYWIVNCK